MFWLAIDLDELEALHQRVVGFGYNSRALASICDADYGGTGPGSIRGKVISKLREHGGPEQVNRITLFTIPRVGGYVFNPVSFYLCYADDRTLCCLVAEVRNTFGEMHHYVVRPELARAGLHRFRFRKSFYVSPFLDVEGTYELQLRATDSEFKLTVLLFQQNQCVFSASMHGRGRPMTSSRLLGTLMSMPGFAVSIMANIHWQALLLRFSRGIHTRPKPLPRDENTISARQRSIWFLIRERLVRWAAGREARREPHQKSIESKGTAT